MSILYVRRPTAPFLSVLFLASLSLAPPLSAQQRPAQPPPQQQAAPPRLQVVPVDQGMLDRWLVLFAEVAPQLSVTPEPPEDKVRAIFDRACRKAQFSDVGQCHAVDDYFGVLISGVSADGAKFVDPMARARQDLAAVNSDKQLTAQKKTEQKAEIEGFLATMPERIPPEHIALLNRNSKRVFDILNKLQGPAGAPQGQPPAQPPGPAPKR